jgi:hypothetical protein
LSDVGRLHQTGTSQVAAWLSSTSRDGAGAGLPWSVATARSRWGR